MNFRNTLPAMIAVGLLVPSVALAQDLVLRVDRGTGDIQLTGASETVVDLAAYWIDSQYGTLDIGSGNFTGIRAIDSNWEAAGPDDANGVAELLKPAGLSSPMQIDNSVVIDLGNFYDPYTAELNGGFLFNAEDGDFTLSYGDLNSATAGVGLIEYVGDRDFNTLVLTVDPVTGEATLENESQFDVTVIGYRINSSVSGILNTNLSTFDGLRDETGGTAFQAPMTLTGDALSELDPTIDQNVAGFDIDSKASFGLGVIGDAGGDFGDLVDNLSFSFILAGGSELERAGVVKYLPTPGNPGDFNGDLVVDAADYAVWRNGLGVDFVASDYDEWRAAYGTNYGAVAAAGGANPAPEPTSTGLVTLAVAALGVGARSGWCGSKRRASCS